MHVAHLTMNNSWHDRRHITAWLCMYLGSVVRMWSERNETNTQTQKLLYSFVCHFGQIHLLNDPDLRGGIYLLILNGQLMPNKC